MPGLYVADSAVMAAFGCGVLTAVVVDVGWESMGEFFFVFLSVCVCV